MVILVDFYRPTYSKWLERIYSMKQSMLVTAQYEYCIFLTPPYIGPRDDKYALYLSRDRIITSFLVEHSGVERGQGTLRNGGL